MSAACAISVLTDELGAVDLNGPVRKRNDIESGRVLVLSSYGRVAVVVNNKSKEGESIEALGAPNDPAVAHAFIDIVYEACPQGSKRYVATTHSSGSGKHGPVAPPGRDAITNRSVFAAAEPGLRAGRNHWVNHGL